MPVAIDWRQDEALLAYMREPKATIRAAALRFGVSRSFVQRRLVFLRAPVMTSRPDCVDALPAGHPITWGAICVSVPTVARIFGRAVAS